MPDQAAQSARKYDAVIFDLYGTLIDLPGTQEQGRARMASTLGIEVDRFREAWRRFRLQRHKGLLTVEESIVATVDYLGVVVEPDAIRAAKAVRYQLIRAQLAPAPRCNQPVEVPEGARLFALPTEQLLDRDSRVVE